MRPSTKASFRACCVLLSDGMGLSMEFWMSLSRGTFGVALTRARRFALVRSESSFTSGFFQPAVAGVGGIFGRGLTGFLCCAPMMPLARRRSTNALRFVCVPATRELSSGAVYVVRSSSAR